MIDENSDEKLVLIASTACELLDETAGLINGIDKMRKDGLFTLSNEDLKIIKEWFDKYNALVSYIDKSSESIKRTVH